MAPLSTRILSYWAACLAEEMRLTPPAEKAPGVAFLDRDVLLRGCLPDEIARDPTGLGAEPEAAAGGSLGPAFPFEVMVAPWVIQKDRRREALYWLWARLAEDGSLSPCPDKPPQINRRLLAPHDDEALIVAELKSWEELRERKQGWGETWTDLVAEVQTEFRALSGLDIETWGPEGYRGAEGVVRRADSLPGPGSAPRPVHDLCRTFASDPPRLLANVLSPPATAVDAKDVQDEVRLGHMGDLRPNAEQATAIRNLAILPEGKVLAISGPPGTGKTAFLASAVADLIVRAFLAGDPPPVILLTSTNNQAVDNAVEALSPAPDSEPAERGRWIEGIAGYGCRWSSMTRRNSGKEKPDQQQIEKVAELLFKPDAWDARARFWLRRYRDWPGAKGESIEDALRTLREACKETTEKAKKLAHALAEVKVLLERGGLEAFERRRACLESLLECRRRRLDEAAREVERARAALTAEKAEWGRQEAAVRAALADGGLVEKFLGFLPYFRLAAWQRVAAAIRRAGDDIPSEADRTCPRALLDAYADRLRMREERWCEERVRPIERYEQTARSRLAATAARAARAEEQHRAVDAVRAAAASNGVEASPPSSDKGLIDAAAKHLDLDLRRRAFDLAMRAREGEFICDGAAGRHEEEWADLWKRPDRADRERQFRAICSVVPCIAATVYVAAGDRAFHCYERGRTWPLSSFIDLMIIDEAGQVAPHLGLPLLGLARRAAVVGDVHQLKPVVQLDARFNDRLEQEAGLDEAERRNLRRQGLDVARGSAMAAVLIASHASDEPRGPSRGILLRAHYRCAKSIIEYCNDLVYGGQLEPKVPDEENPRLPHLGYAHIRGIAERSGSSWRNPTEAAAIACWISENERILLNDYGKPRIGEVLAVVTPYAAQKRLVEQELNKCLGERAESITIGTVHALQGAERPVIVFSPTVTAGPSSVPHYDHEPNLLNVAVSHAQRSFLFFGDMRLCASVRRCSPLRLLGDRLRRHEANQIKGVNPFALEPEVQRLVNAKEHDEFLKRRMKGARKRVIISSFNAWPKPIKDAGIDRLTREVSQKVSVSFLIGVPKRAGPSLDDALDLLAGCGAAVFTSDTVHTKTVVIDDDVIVEGSFNWCGAYRDRNASEERSFALSGDKARLYVEQAAAEFEKLAGGAKG